MLHGEDHLVFILSGMCLWYRRRMPMGWATGILLQGRITPCSPDPGCCKQLWSRALAGGSRNSHLEMEFPTGTTVLGDGESGAAAVGGDLGAFRALGVLGSLSWLCEGRIAAWTRMGSSQACGRTLWGQGGGCRGTPGTLDGGEATVTIALGGYKPITLAAAKRTHAEGCSGG